ncbi:hypothetical protein EM858_26235 [Agrobacterium sp. CNPSo 2736]|nr:hypothetical protein EM858_26235 [Agrobacterium sp. CNPSo 2736]
MGIPIRVLEKNSNAAGKGCFVTMRTVMSPTFSIRSIQLPRLAFMTLVAGSCAFFYRQLSALLWVIRQLRAALVP